MELRDELLRAMTADGAASLRVLCATNLVREATSRHATAPAASVALGRTLMGGLVLATSGQDGERVQLRIRGDGPLGGVTVTADSEGTTRGFVHRPQADAPLGSEHLELSRALGLGSLAVDRNHASWKHPYSGIVPLVHGEVAQDLARYLLESEQKPATVALGIYLGIDGAVEAAAAYLVQGLPGADDEVLAELEARVGETPNPSELVRAGATARDLLGRLAGDLDVGVPESLTPRFHCPCSVDRVLRAAMLLGREEIRDIVERGEVLEVRCEFCAEVYHLPADDLGRMSLDA